jgi:putative transposase
MPHYPRHLATFDYRGFHRYFLTLCTFERNPYFIDAKNVAIAYEQILRAAGDQHFALVAYCFMPDHLHLLIEGTREDAYMKEFVARAKQFSGFYFKKQTKNRLWQRYGFEHVLRDDEDAPSVVRYLLENPVRAGLVTTPTEYPFWGSSVHSRRELLEYLSGRLKSAPTTVMPCACSAKSCRGCASASRAAPQSIAKPEEPRRRSMPARCSRAG